MGHVGDIIFLMQDKYLANGMCPVLSCMIMLVDFFGSVEIVFTKRAEDVCGSVLLMYVKHGDVDQTSCNLCLVLDLKACFAAELLKGRGEVSNFGSLDGLELL